MIKVICTRAELSGNYTNHSGKRTCVTQLYMAGVDGQELLLRTGHRDLSEPSREKTNNLGFLPGLTNNLSVQS